MSTLIFVLGLVVAVAGLLVGLGALFSLVGGHLRGLSRQFRGASADVQCPLTGQTTRIRINTRDILRPSVLCCERFGDGEVRCHAECLRAVASSRS